MESGAGKHTSTYVNDHLAGWFVVIFLGLLRQLVFCVCKEEVCCTADSADYRESCMLLMVINMQTK